MLTLHAVRLAPGCTRTLQTRAIRVLRDRHRVHSAYSSPKIAVPHPHAGRTLLDRPPRSHATCPSRAPAAAPLLRLASASRSCAAAEVRPRLLRILAVRRHRHQPAHRGCAGRDTRRMQHLAHRPRRHPVLALLGSKASPPPAPAAPCPRRGRSVQPLRQLHRIHRVHRVKQLRRPRRLVRLQGPDQVEARALHRAPAVFCWNSCTRFSPNTRTPAA